MLLEANGKLQLVPAEMPKKSAAQLKKEAKRKKLEKYKTKMKATEVSKAAAVNVSEANLLELIITLHFSSAESKRAEESGERIHCA